MFRIKLFIFSLLCTGLFLTSCEDDLTGGGTGTGGGGSINAPEVSLPDGLDVIEDNAIVEPGSTFRIQVMGDKVTGGDLNSIEVFRDGSSIAIAFPDPEFEILEVDIPNNPQSLLGLEESFTFTYEFVAPTEIGFYTYDFEVTDVDGLVSSASKSISVEGEAIDPTLVLNAPAVIDAPANSLVKVNVTATMGSNDIASISVWEDGSIIMDLDRLRYNDILMEANPLPLFAPDTQGFEGGVTILTTTGSHTYAIVITDTQDNSTNVMFEINEQSTMTPLQNVFDFVLFSNASGAGLGGLDLDNGVAVPSASDQAEIRDRGIDIGQPASTNWIQQIEPRNGSELRIVDVSSIENFSFDAVTSKEQVAEAFNGGTPVDPSPVLQVGDILAVSSPTNIYIMQVETVNVTTGDNDDFYEFSIKF